MQALGHVLWIGGPPGAGKTTVAKRIARRHGLRWYDADSHTWEHRDRALRAGDPAAVRWEAMTPEERWTAPLAELKELWLDEQRGPMIAEDLRLLPPSPLTVAEGTPVRPGLADAARAVWLLPTREFQTARLEERGAGASWLALALLLADEIEEQALDCGVEILRVDGSLDVEQTVGAVERLFAEALATGPRADSVAERRSLVRDSNATIVARYVAYFARPWTTGDVESTVVAFSCECGDPECGATVRLAVAAFPGAGPPVLADGHD